MAFADIKIVKTYGHVQYQGKFLPGNEYFDYVSIIEWKHVQIVVQGSSNK